MLQRDRKVLGFILAAALLYFGLQLYIAVAVVPDTASVHSSSPLGLQIFQELRQKLRPGRLTVLAKPFLQPGIVARDAVYLLLGPTRSVSAFEAKQLELFAKRGGTIVATFHSPETYVSLEEVVQLVEPGLKMPSAQPWSKARLEVVVPKADGDLLQLGTSYRFYTLLSFADLVPPAKGAVCAAPPADFYCHKAVGRGHIYVLASVPLFSNGLIGLGDNQTFAARLALLPQPMVIDEYHHFFTEKKLRDLVLDAKVSAPLLGLVALMLAFFCFGDSPLPRSAEADHSGSGQRSYHEFNVGLIARQLRRPSAIIEASEVVRHNLIRLYPEARTELAAQHHLTIDTLIQWHKNLLLSKGGKRS